MSSQRQKASGSARLRFADGADAVLLIHAPTPFFRSAEIAGAVCQAAEGAPHDVFACWVGGESAVDAWVFGLQQNSSARSNLAIVNAGLASATSTCASDRPSGWEARTRHAACAPPVRTTPGSRSILIPGASVT